MKKQNFFIFFLLILTPSVFWARHIVGGEITYRLLSTDGVNNRIEFTMRIYRDCNSINGAPFDENAAIGIYRKESGTRFTSFFVPIGAITRVSAPNLPCLIPPDVCVQQGEYIWTRDLPRINETYIILYQRCCRNETISNIQRPGSAGATYTVEISPYAQEVGNNSPTFKTFPPTIICGNEPLNFDHSATDTEGDQLVYSFCNPYGGGGQTGGNGCDQTSPNPPCWPPFGAVVFRQPQYTFQQPVGGNPIVAINPNTGRITGTPTELGQYVVSVCVEEYRNGKLLSVLKRDFQFNVAQCDPTVRGEVKADTIINNTFVVSSCGEKFIQVENRSLDQRFINDFRFVVNMNNGNTETFKDWQPRITFPDTGVFKGNLFLNPGTQCADTINLQFNIFSSILSDFTYEYDTCIAGPVTFRDNSKSTNGTIIEWKWQFGDGKDTLARNVSHLYQTPGQKSISLSIRDSKGCKEDTIRTINWQPVPPLIVIQPSSFTGCTPANLFFNNLSRPIDSTYDIRWTFGDGGTSTAISPTYVYENPGVYSINVEITSPIGCKTSRNFKDLIKVNQGSKADFEFSPEKLTKLKNTVSFVDKSQFASRWSWLLNEKAFSARQNPSYTFKDTGIQKIKLLVSNQYGCTDSLVKFLDVIPEVSYFLPNAFTPNNDSNNDFYKGVGIVDGMKAFDMKIWNRWGELIFESSDPNEGWNGKKFNTGADSPEGVYLCVVTFTAPRGEVFQKRSFATLIR